MLKTYDEFTARVDKLGFMLFYGRFPEGFPVLQAETEGWQWHTGDADTDPWQWKDRAAEERRLAFGCILGGYKGFVSKRLYPLFYAACRPPESMEERNHSGEISRTEWEIYRLFQDGLALSTADLRRTLGVTKKSGAATADSALKTLQKEYIITVCGNRRKVSFAGVEYGWPANTYCLVENWAPQWLEGADSYDSKEARRKILDIGCPGTVDRDALSKLLFGKLK